jgi:hypothetical protein
VSAIKIPGLTVLQIAEKLTQHVASGIPLAELFVVVRHGEFELFHEHPEADR